MPSLAFRAKPNQDDGAIRSKSGHVSGRAVAGIVVTEPAKESERAVRSRTAEQYGGSTVRTSGSGPSRKTSVSSGGALSSENSYEAPPPRWRPQNINAELVKLVASFAPLELAQLKAAEQKARLKRVRATEAAAVQYASAPGITEADDDGAQGMELESTGGSHTVMPPFVAQPLEATRLPTRPSTADTAKRLGQPTSVPAGRARSQSLTRHSHLPAAPAKGAVVKRDMNILPNPVAQKHTEASQRQAAVSSFVKKLQREQDLLRAEKEKRIKAEQDALAAQVVEEERQGKAAAAEAKHAPAPEPAPSRLKKPATAGFTNAAPTNLEADDAGKDVPKKTVYSRPWRENMRKKKNLPVSGEAPIGAPCEVAAKAATGPPPPRYVSPGAVAARTRTLDPVARSEVKEYMNRKMKEMAAKQHQEKVAQLEAKAAPLKVLKVEMAKARERAHKYAEAAKEQSSVEVPRPAWLDIVPAEGSAVTIPRAPSTQQTFGAGPDVDMVADRAMPYHMSDALRMEATERQRQDRRPASASSDVGRAVLVDSYGHALDNDGWSSGPQVVRIQDPNVLGQAGRLQRSNSARLVRPLGHNTSTLAQAVAKQIQIGHPVAPATLRAIEQEARLMARKNYEQHQRELQAVERRDISLGRDTSRGRDNSRGRQRSPTAGRKHEATSLNSRSRSPPKRARQQVWRSRSASRTGSANRRVAVPPQPAAAASGAQHHGVQRLHSNYPAVAQAGIQQAQNDRQVGELWELALELSARLGALKQQGAAVVPAQPIEAWPDDQSQFEEEQQVQQLVSSVHGPIMASLLPYPPPVTVVPTGISADFGHAIQNLPGARQVQLFDATVEADLEFRTEDSWPLVANKKSRTDGSSTLGFNLGRGARIDTSSRSSFDVLNGNSGEKTSLFDGSSDVGGLSHGHPAANSFSSDEDDGHGNYEEDGHGDISSLTSGLHPTSVIAGTGPSELATGPSQGSFSTYSRDQDDPSLLGRSGSGSPVHRIRSEDEPSIRGARFRAPVPSSSPTKHVPAAPVIQIPLLSSSARMSAAAHEIMAPSAAGLPYDNATFSAESADEDGRSNSSGESVYGHRVLSIDELHTVPVEDPRLAQRLSSERDYDRLEDVYTESPTGTSRIRLPLRQSKANLAGDPRLEQQPIAPSSPSYGGLSENSDDGGGRRAPPRQCGEIVDEYEWANSPLRPRPARRELLKAQAVQWAEEQLEASESESNHSLDERSPRGTFALPRSGDPMSLINLVTSSGQLPARPTIIQLFEPLMLDGILPDTAERATQTAQMLSSGSNAAHPPLRQSAEVLVVPSPKGPQVVLARELLQPPQQRSPRYILPPKTTVKEAGVGDGRVDTPTHRSAQQLTDSLPPFVVITETTSAAALQPMHLQQQQHDPNPSIIDSSKRTAMTSPHSPSVTATASLQQQVDAMQTIHQQQLKARGLSELGNAGGQRFDRRDEVQAAAVAAEELGGDDDCGPFGAMVSPPPRPRMVTFLDEVQGPPERVRLAPVELFNQMQKTLRSYEQLDAAELELQQLQNARAIAAVQREAHRIAQRLDQSATAEAQMQLIAHNQAEMDSKLHAFEENIRDEIRRESLGHIAGVTSLFVEQLSRNKVVQAHSTVQTTPPQSPRRPAIGVQTSTLSIPESVSEERSRSQPPFLWTRAPSALLSAESTVVDRFTTDNSRVGDGGGGDTESLPFPSMTGGESQGYSSIQESLNVAGRSATTLSGTSRRRHSEIQEVSIEPTYSTGFEDVEDDDSPREVQSEPSGHPSSQNRRSGVSSSSKSPDYEVATHMGSSPGYSKDVEEDIGLSASHSAHSLPGDPGKPLASTSSPALAARNTQRHGDLAGVDATSLSGRAAWREPGSSLSGPSPLSLRASIDGGLELDDEFMALYVADAEKRMRQEVALLQDRLQDINRRAASKMDQMESELTMERLPQKRQALIRAQRLLQVQHDADASDIQRQISTIKADYSRQQLMLERLYRLAQLTSPGGAFATKRRIGTVASDGHRLDYVHGRAETAAERTRRTSSSRSIEDAVPSQQQLSAAYGSVEEEGSSRRVHSSASSIADDAPQLARRASSGSSIRDDVSKVGSATTDVDEEEYSESFEHPSLMPSRSQLFQGSGRLSRRNLQPSSSIVDDIEENLSGRRPGGSGGQSQSVVTEDNFRRSSTASGPIIAVAKGRRPASSSVATESPYSEDFNTSGPSGKQSQRSRPMTRRGASVAKTDDLDSDLSALSLKLEREKAVLARQLREEKEWRRAKILSKQAEVMELRAKLAALQGKVEDRRAPPAKHESTPYTTEDNEDSGSSVDDEMSEVASRAEEVDSGSKEASSIPEVSSQRDAASVQGFDIVEEYDDDGSKDKSHSQNDGSKDKSHSQNSSRNWKDTTSATPSAEPIDPDLAAIQREVAILEEAVRREKEAQVQAMYQYKDRLQAQLKSLKGAAQLPQPSKPPIPASAPQRRKVAPPPVASSYGTSGPSPSYSDDFSAAGSVADITTASSQSLPGVKSSSTIVEVLVQAAALPPVKSVSSIVESDSQISSEPRISAQPVSSRSMSISEERINSIPQTSHGLTSHSSGIEEETTNRTAPHSFYSSGAVGGTSGEMYEESFETESEHGESSFPEGSDIQDTAAMADVARSDPAGSALDAVLEEDGRSSSISYAADSVVGHSVRESSVFRSSDTGFVGFLAPGADAQSIAESSYFQDAAAQGTGSESVVDDDALKMTEGQASIASDQFMDETNVTTSIRDEQGIPGSGSTDNSSFSNSVEDDVESFGGVQSRAPHHKQEDGPDSSVMQSTLPSEFFTTADINSPSVTPSIHSSEMETSANRTTSSVGITWAPIYTPASRSVLSQPETAPVAEFLTTSNIESGHPSFSENAGDARSTSIRELVRETSEEAVEEEVRQLLDGIRSGQAKEVGEDSSGSVLLKSLTDASIEETQHIKSADIVQRPSTTVSASAVEEATARTSSALESREDVVDDVSSQSSAAMGSAIASALPEESQVETYEHEFQVSVLEQVDGKESAPRQSPGGTVVNSSSASQLMSTGQGVPEDQPEEELEVDEYELDVVDSELPELDVVDSKELKSSSVTTSSSQLMSVTGEVREQDTAEIMSQTSLQEVASTLSVGSRRLASTQASLKAVASILHQQASSLSVATYEEDFEDGELSELQLPGTAVVGRALSVVEEEVATRAQPDSSVSMIYSADFPSASTLVPYAAAVPPAAKLTTTTSLRSAAAESSATEVAAEDLEYDFEAVEADEEEQQLSAGSGDLMGRVFPPAATASVAALEVSQRYGPASEQSTSAYSDDISEQAGGDTLSSSAGGTTTDLMTASAPGRNTDKEMQPLKWEPRNNTSLHSLSTQSAERRLAAPAAAAAVAAAAAPAPQELQSPVDDVNSWGQNAPTPLKESTSVFSVHEEDATSGTVSSEASDQLLSKELTKGSDILVGRPPVSDARRIHERGMPEDVADVGGDDDDDDDDYTREFIDLPSGMMEVQSSILTMPAQVEKDSTAVSHPISQPPSPPGGSGHSVDHSAHDGDDGNDEGYGDSQDSDVGIPDEVQAEDLDLSDPGLTPVATALVGAAAPQPGGGLESMSSELQQVQVRSGLMSEAPSITTGEVEGEHSGILVVPRGRGIRQTRQIESRTWRNQQTPLDEEEGLGVDMDLLDVSGLGEGSGLLDALGADLIMEASEGTTPSHSFRTRGGEPASGPSSSSPSPYGVRSAQSVRLATLRESLDHEGEDTATTSDIVPPSATWSRFKSGEGAIGSLQVRQRYESDSAGASEYNPIVHLGDEEEEEEEEEEEGIQVQAGGSEVAVQLPSELARQLTPERSVTPMAAAAAATAAEVVLVSEQSASTAVVGAAVTWHPAAEASAEPSARYSDDLEAPGGEISSARLSVLEYDPYTSTMAVDDSDELEQVAAAFESQAIGVDEDDDNDAMDRDRSQISASGLSDDLAQYQVELTQDSDDEAGARRTVVTAPGPTAPALVPVVAALPGNTEDKEQEDAPSVEASEVQDEASVAGASNPFSVDESDDRLPTLQPAFAALLRAPHTVTAAAPPPTAPVVEAKGVGAGPIATVVSPAGSSPTASSTLSGRSGRDSLPEESSLGPLPRSRLNDDDEGQGLEYLAVYGPHHGGPADVPSTAERPLSGEAAASSAPEGHDGAKAGFLDKLRAMTNSDDEDAEDIGSIGASRVGSAASLRPMFQALLDQPESDSDLPKGDFESEIEEMLLASRSRSRLVSPFQSRDLAADLDPQEQDVNTPSSLARESQASGQTFQVADASAVSARGAAVHEAGDEAAAAARDDFVEDFTEATVTDVVEAAAAARQAEADGSSDVSSGGDETVSVTMDDLEADIELDVHMGHEADGRVDLPSPIPSDSGSLNSFMRAPELPGVSNLSPDHSPVPALGPERSDRDMALSGSLGDGDIADGITLSCDEELGWGITELEDDWQPDVSGLIAPEMDQAAIERENAPAVSTGASAVAEYASQVLDQFMENRPEFLVPGSEPLSLEGFLDQERRLVNASEAQHIHNKMVYDAVNEALLGVYRAANRIQNQPWLQRNRIVKPLPSPSEMARQVQEQLRAWAAMRTRDAAEVDKVLVTDAQEDERARGDLSVEEAEVQREAADLIWDDLIEDTARQLAELEQLLAPSPSIGRRGGMPVAGRRRLGPLAS